MILDELSKIAKCECRECYNFFKYRYGSTGKYCSQSCAAKENNRTYVKRKKLDDKEIVPTGKYKSGKIIYKTKCSEATCETLIGVRSKYCSDHYSEVQAQSKLDKWLSGEWSGGTKLSLSQTIRTYLLEQANYKCSSCGFDKRHPDDNSCILEIDHSDGNPENHRPENLRVLCPNCHALTSTYRGRNAGSGRKLRYT